MRSDRPQVIVGLGNPGSQYAHTRHNMGFLVVQAYAERCAIVLREEKKFSGLYGRGEGLHLLLPLTYMNLSGEAVGKLVRYYNIEPGQLLVVTDDVALPFGSCRLRQAGSAGGHNGLKSVIATLGTQEFPRLRIGVGNPGSPEMADYVLARFSPDEQKALPSLLAQCCEWIERVRREEFGRVMTECNRRRPLRGEKDDRKEDASL